MEIWLMESAPKAVVLKIDFLKIHEICRPTTFECTQMVVLQVYLLQGVFHGVEEVGERRGELVP